jgi:recombination protein RecT
MEEKKQQVETVKKNISTVVLEKIDAFKATGELRLPKDYSAENALKSAYLILSDPRNNLLAKCTQNSVADALLKMVVWGLSPLKKQCDFIAYGDKLDCSIEYTGNIALAKRYGCLKTIKANAVFAGDTFEFCIDPATGLKKIVKHEQTLESVGSKEIKGAYAIVTLEDGTVDTEVMSISQIRDAWNQGAMKGNSPAHKNFPDQMAMKTVINRACKLLIRSSDDSILFDENDEQGLNPVQREIRENANIEEVGFTDIEDEEPVIPISVETKPQPEAKGKSEVPSAKVNESNVKQSSVPF